MKTMRKLTLEEETGFIFHEQNDAEVYKEYLLLDNGPETDPYRNNRIDVHKDNEWIKSFSDFLEAKKWIDANK